jgi:hypothetical protein
LGKNIELSCGRDIGIVCFLYPGYPVVSGLSEWMSGSGFIWVGEGVVPEFRYSVVVVRRVGRYRVDEVEGFCLFCKEVVGREVPDRIRGLSEEDFWVEVKRWYVCGYSVNSVNVSEGGVWGFFKGLFGDLGEKYRMYREIGVGHQRLMASVLTMMSKVLDLGNPSIGGNYRKMLLEHKPYYGLFRERALEYCLSERSEEDFLSFLMGLSKGGGLR